MKLITQLVTIVLGGIFAMLLTAGALHMPALLNISPALAYAGLAASTGLIGCTWFVVRMTKLPRQLLNADVIVGIVALAGLVQSVSLIATRVEWQAVPGSAHSTLVAVMVGAMLLSVASLLLASNHLAQLTLEAVRHRRPLFA